MERGNLNIIEIASSLTLLAMTYYDMVLSRRVNSYEILWRFHKGWSLCYNQRSYKFINKYMGNFFQVPVNYLAVLLCGISNIVIGMIWYGPFFGKEWEKLVGLTKEKKELAKKNMPQTYFLMFLSSLVTAYALFHFIWYAAPGSLTLFISIKTAMWGFVGLVLPISLEKYLFSPDQKPIRLLSIEVGYHLVSLLMMGVIFYLFR